MVSEILKKEIIKHTGYQFPALVQTIGEDKLKELTEYIIPQIESALEIDRYVTRYYPYHLRGIGIRKAYRRENGNRRTKL